MSENTAKSACSQAEFDMARKAGLFIGTTSDERAVHDFAESLLRSAKEERSALLALLNDVSGSLALAIANSSDRVDWSKDDSLVRSMLVLAKSRSAA